MRSLFALLLVLVLLPLVPPVTAAVPSVKVDLTDLAGDVVLVANRSFEPRPDIDIVRYRASPDGDVMVQRLDFAAPLPANDTTFAFTFTRTTSRVAALETLPVSLEFDGARAVDRGTQDFGANATLEGSAFTLRFPTSKLGEAADCFQVRVVVTHDPATVPGQGWKDEFQVLPNLCTPIVRLDGMDGTCPAAPDLSDVETDARDEDARGDVKADQSIVDSPGHDITSVSTKLVGDHIEVRLAFAGASKSGGSATIGLDVKEDNIVDSYDQSIHVSFGSFGGYEARGRFLSSTQNESFYFPVRLEQWGSEVVGSFCASLVPSTVTCWGLDASVTAAHDEPSDRLEEDEDCVDADAAAEEEGSPTTTTTTGGDPEAEKGTPGFAPLALLVALVGVALARRK